MKIRVICGKNRKHSALVECFFCGRYPRVGLSALSFVPQAPQKDAAAIPNANPALKRNFSIFEQQTNNNECDSLFSQYFYSFPE